MPCQIIGIGTGMSYKQKKMESSTHPSFTKYDLNLVFLFAFKTKSAMCSHSEVAT